MKRIISIISVISLLCTMFSLPVMAEDATTNVFTNNWTPVNLATAVGNNAATYGFADRVTSDNHLIAGANMGTHAHKGSYYHVFEADAFAAPKPVSAVYGENTGKLTVNFDSYSSVWSNVKAYKYGANDRFYFSTYVNNLAGNVHDLCFMPSAAGVNMTKWYSYTFPKNVWTKLDVVYDPNVTYTYTVDGVSKTVSTVDKTIPYGYNHNSKYPASSEGDEKASNRWTPILALDGSTYNADSTYVMSKVQFGEMRIYIDGKLASATTNAVSYNTSSTNFYFYDSVPNRFVFNRAGVIALSNMKFATISNFDEATFLFNQPTLSTVEGKFIVDGIKLCTTKGYINKSDIVVPAGAVVKAYSKDSEVTVAGGYKYTEITDDTLPVGTLVTVQEDKDGGERITYTVSDDVVYENYVDGSALTEKGNASMVYASGVAGKAADDKSAAVIPDGKSADAFFGMEKYYGVTTEQLMAFNGYMHISFNAIMENTDDNVFLRVSSDKGATVAANNANYTADKIFNRNQWNRVDVVIKLEGGKTAADAGKSNGVAKFYANGKFIGENNTSFGGYVAADRKGAALRIGIPTTNTSSKLWLDDFKVVFSKGEPVVPEMPAAVTANIGDTVASVIAQGAKAFKDDLYNVLLADEEVLSHGNVIVKEENGTYAYTVIDDADIKSYMVSNDTFTSNVRFDADWSVTGIGGKSASDHSLKLTKKAVGEDASDTDKANYVNIYPQFTYDRGEDAKDYVVIGFNVFVPSESKFENVSINSQQHTNLGNTVGSNYLTRDKWNSLISVIDYTGENATTTMYLNGNVFGEANKKIGTKKTSEGEVQEFGGSIFNQIRLSIRTGDYKDTSIFYMDDIIVFETDEKYVPAKLTENTDFGSKYDLVDGDRLYTLANADITVAEIKEKVAGAVITRAGEVLADDAIIAKGDAVYYGEVSNYCKNLSGYKTIVVSGTLMGNDGIRMYKANGSDTIAAGDTVRARVADGGVLIVAGYDASGAMTSVDFDMESTASYKDVVVPSAETVSFMAVDSFEALKPLYKNYEISAVSK